MNVIMQYIKHFVSWYVFVITCTTLTTHGAADLLVTDATTTTDTVVGQTNTTSADSTIQLDQGSSVRGMTKKDTERFIVCDGREDNNYCDNQGVCLESMIHKGVYVCNCTKEFYGERCKQTKRGSVWLFVALGIGVTIILTLVFAIFFISKKYPPRKDIIFTKWQLHYLTKKLGNETANNNDERKIKLENGGSITSLQFLDQQHQRERKETMLDLRKLYFVSPDEEIL